MYICHTSLHTRSKLTQQLHAMYRSLGYYVKSFSTSEGRYRCCLGTLAETCTVCGLAAVCRQTRRQKRIFCLFRRIWSPTVWIAVYPASIATSLCYCESKDKPGRDERKAGGQPLSVSVQNSATRDKLFHCVGISLHARKLFTVFMTVSLSCKDLYMDWRDASHFQGQIWAKILLEFLLQSYLLKLQWVKELKKCHLVILCVCREKVEWT